MTSRYRYKCSKYTMGPELPENIRKYEAKCCPVPSNSDPRRFETYCPPVKCLSEPLSHAEYLRQKKANNGAPISSPANLVQIGGGSGYVRTIWTASSSPSPCCAGSGGTLPAVPAAMAGGDAIDEGLRIESVGAAAGRGTLSKYDMTSRDASKTTLRRHGQAIETEKCGECSTLVGTEIYPGSCLCLK